MSSMHSNVEFVYKLSICYRTVKKHGKLDLVARSQDLLNADF
jgi:hypothetical protein